jgi:transcriptional regulator with XRE-family HTH domain
VQRISAGTLVDVSRVGDALEAERRRRELSQEEAGRAIGRSQPAFHRYVSGRPVPLAIAPAVAAFLRQPLGEVRDMILESHEDDQVSEVPRRSAASRLDDLERELAALRNDVAELGRTPRRAGKRSPDGSKHGAP